jgi:GAF domain-containing protein
VSIDSQALDASLRRLAGRGAVRDVVPALEDVITACVELFDISGSGVMVADEQNITRYVAASNSASRALEIAESRTGQGPCTTAFVTNEAVASDDLTADDRWPDLASDMTSSGVCAILGVPVRLGGVPVGTLNVYRDRRQEWTDRERAAVSRYAEVVGATLSASLEAHRAGELAGQLQYALDYRIIIERGVGYLMASEGIDALAAFNELRTAARNRRVKIGAVAEELLATGRLRTG